MGAGALKWAQTWQVLTERWGVRPVAEPFVEVRNVNRLDLADLFGHLGLRSGAEIGVDRGEYTAELARRNPTGFVYAVDSWRAYKGFRMYRHQAQLDATHEEAVQRLAPLANVVIRHMSSADAAAATPDRSLDWVYIDANHRLDYVMVDLFTWVPKVRPGGIISGHDWGRRTRPGDELHVQEAVMTYASVYGVKPLVVVGSKEIVPGEKRDRPRSWLWVKESTWT